MQNKQFIVIAYDISNDKRRTRLHKKLLSYGTPVQYSLFECILTADELKKLKREINKIIKTRIDHVRYYTLCGRCQNLVEATGRKEVSSEKEVYIV